MHFSFIEIEDNFVPDVVQDPYRRLHIRSRVEVKEGENIEDARKALEDYIKDYIKENTVLYSQASFDEQPLPDIQVDKLPMIGRSMEDQIKSCKTLEELSEYKLIAGMNKKLEAIYSTRHLQLL